MVNPSIISILTNSVHFFLALWRVKNEEFKNEGMKNNNLFLI